MRARRDSAGFEVVDLERYDPALAARVQGERLQNAEAELAAFPSEHFAQLVAEVSPEALAAAKYRQHPRRQLGPCRAPPLRD